MERVGDQVISVRESLTFWVSFLVERSPKPSNSSARHLQALTRCMYMILRILSKYGDFDRCLTMFCLKIGKKKKYLTHFFLLKKKIDWFLAIGFVNFTSKLKEKRRNIIINQLPRSTNALPLKFMELTFFCGSMLCCLTLTNNFINKLFGTHYSLFPHRDQNDHISEILNSGIFLHSPIFVDVIFCRSNKID